MKKKNVILLAWLLSGIVCGAIISKVNRTLQVRKQVKIELVKQEKKAVNDSIILLNKLWVQENQRYISVMVALDSISRKGGTLPFTNFKGKVFELNLIAK